MRVLVSPGADPDLLPAAAHVARVLAAGGPPPVLLGKLGVKNLARRLTPAEVVLIRQALLGSAEGNRRTPKETIVGYVCAGRSLVPAENILVMVPADHANLTFVSPLRGPNDDALGPRFPSLTGVYAVAEAEDLLSGLGEGMIVRSGVVAEVRNQAALSRLELDLVRALGITVVSSELAPVVILAAHLGLRVAGAVVI